MADADYQRLGAACHCGAPIKAFAGRGRPPKYCGDHGWKPPNGNGYEQVERACVFCAKAFRGIKAAKFCGEKCAGKAGYARLLERKPKKDKQATSHVCEQCHAEFVGFKTAKFCGGVCRNTYYNRKARNTVVDRVCNNCGAGFVDNKLDRRRTCSEKCRKAVQTAAARNHLGSRPLNTHTCRVCSVTYQTTAIRSNSCSKKCKLQAWYASKGGYSYKSAAHEARLAEARSKRSAIDAEKRALREIEVSAAKAAVVARIYWNAELRELWSWDVCVVCGQGCRKSKRHGTCSDECAASRKRAARHAERVARRAILKAARVDTVDPFKVFDRDDWTCYLCGGQTPRSLRGTYEDAAPEVEHVVPITRGGKDAYDNVRCACRKCNLIKADFLLEEIGGAFA